MKRPTIAVLLAVLSSSAVLMSALSGCLQKAPDNQQLKPRIVVLTDIGPADVEPDDNESAVRLLSYADRYEIEAICTTVGWNCDPYPEEWVEYLNRVVDAYEIDVLNLRKRSAQTEFRSLEKENGKQELGYWPSADYIRSRVMSGSHRGGIGVIGEDNDSEGSDMLIRLADEDDDRPIYVCAWGGANTLSQAIWKVRQTRTPEELKAFLHKFRLYTITDQDMHYSKRMDREYSSHMWLRSEFPDDLLFVWDESAWLNQNALGVANWEKYAELIQNHGEMGKVYPHYLWGVEGDTPSFLNVNPNGLNDPEHPEQVGWGGMHIKGISPDGKTVALTNWDKPVKTISNRYEKQFYPDEFNDFAARMQWAATGEGNHNPVAIINGRDGIKPLEITVSAGENVKIDASASYDPDGDALSFKWWFQQFPEGGYVPAMSTKPDETENGPQQVTVLISENAVPGMTWHLVCEVHDDGAFTLPAYRRVIFTVK